MTSNPVVKIGKASLCRFSIILNFSESFIYAIVPDNDAIDACKTIDYTRFVFSLLVLRSLILFCIQKQDKEYCIYSPASRKLRPFKIITFRKNVLFNRLCLRLTNYEV